MGKWPHVVRHSPAELKSCCVGSPWYVARYAPEGWADGHWRTLSEGTTIGYRKIDRFAPAAVQRMRLSVHDAATEPTPVTVQLYRPPPA